jgi:gentisate 1,2-dioxygenase
MRICRFDDNRLGVVTGDGIHDVTQTLKELPTWTYPLPMFDPFIAELPKLSAAMERQARQSAPKPVDGVRLLSPVASPGKIIAAPVNYKKHLFQTRPMRSTDGMVMAVADGRGTLQIADRSFAFSSRDIHAIPGWNWRSFKASEDCFLFFFSDRVAQEKLGLFREERRGLQN